MGLCETFKIHTWAGHSDNASNPITWEAQQEGLEFKANLNYTARPSLKKEKKTFKGWRCKAVA
jgi:hypothetical protein